MDYLNCRMNAGLMEKEEMEKLGFQEKVEWSINIDEHRLHGRVRNKKRDFCSRDRDRDRQRERERERERDRERESERER